MYVGFFLSGPTGYYVNGASHYCAFLSEAQWVASGGPPFSQVPVWPSIDSCYIYDGVCQPPPTLLSQSPTPTFASNVVMMQDTFMYASSLAPPMAYRLEGDASQVTRQPGFPGTLSFTGGPVGYVHAARYRRATLQVKLKVQNGEPILAIAHNGNSDRQGAPLPNRGVQVRLRPTYTLIEDATTGAMLGVIPEAFPRDGTERTLSIAWNIDLRSMRVDMPGGSYLASLPASVAAGGFAVRVASGPSSAQFSLSQVSALWQDPRPVRYWHGYREQGPYGYGAYHYDQLGTPRILPPLQFPGGQHREYFYAGSDIRTNKALIAYFYPGQPFSWPLSDGKVEGYAVWDIATGQLDLLGQRPGGCLVAYGGMAFDGSGIYSSVPVNPRMSWAYDLCRVDWNAYNSGNKAGLLTLYASATRGADQVIRGFADGGMALDGSILSASYVTIDTINGNHLFTQRFFQVPPELASTSGFSLQNVPVSSESTQGWRISQTGPGALPTSFSVSDVLRGFFENWVYAAPATTLGLHVSYGGFNLFADPAVGLDWQTQNHFWETADYEDVANCAPSFLVSNQVLCWRHVWHANERPNVLHTFDWLSFGWYTLGWQEFIDNHQTVRAPVQILLDPNNLTLQPGL